MSTSQFSYSKFYTLRTYQCALDGPRDESRHWRAGIQSLGSRLVRCQSTSHVIRWPMETYQKSRHPFTYLRYNCVIFTILDFPFFFQRRLTYSRHAVHDRDLSSSDLLNHNMHINSRRMMDDSVRKSQRSKRSKNSRVIKPNRNCNENFSIS